MAVAVLFSEMLEYFDSFQIGFVVSLIAKPSHLTYGASASSPPKLRYFSASNTVEYPIPVGIVGAWR